MSSEWRSPSPRNADRHRPESARAAPKSTSRAAHDRFARARESGGHGVIAPAARPPGRDIACSVRSRAATPDWQKKVRHSRSRGSAPKRRTAAETQAGAVARLVAIEVPRAPVQRTEWSLDGYDPIHVRGQLVGHQISRASQYWKVFITAPARLSAPRRKSAGRSRKVAGTTGSWRAPRRACLPSPQPLRAGS